MLHARTLHYSPWQVYSVGEVIDRTEILTGWRTSWLMSTTVPAATTHKVPDASLCPARGTASSVSSCASYAGAPPSPPLTQCCRLSVATDVLSSLLERHNEFVRCEQRAVLQLLSYRCQELDKISGRLCAK